MQGLTYREILEKEGISGKEMAQMLGLEYGSYRAAMSQGAKKGAPRWMKAFVMGYNLAAK